MELTPYDMTIVPVIVGLVQVLRRAGVPPRWLPICAIMLGVVGGCMYIYPDNAKFGILSGIIMGLTSIGAWSGIHNTIKENSTIPRNGE